MNEMIESVFDPRTTTKNFNEKKTIKNMEGNEN